MPVIAFVDRAIWVRPGGVLAQERQKAIAVAPEHVEAVPLHVKRQMCEQPLRAFADRIGIAFDRPRPLRRPLKHGQRRRAIGNGGYELHRGCAGADHSDALAIELEVVRPKCRMQDQALKILLAHEMRARGIVELADSADQHRRFERFLAVFRLQGRDPALFAFIPTRRRELRVEAQVLADAVFSRDFLQIVEQFFARAEIAGPGVSRAEGVGIGMVRRVDAAAGIAVDVPCAAEFGVLLNNSVADAESPSATASAMAQTPAPTIRT